MLPSTFITNQKPFPFFKNFTFFREPFFRDIGYSVGWKNQIKSVPNPTEPASKLTLYYHAPSRQCCAVRVQSITESKKEKEEGEIK